MLELVDILLPSSYKTPTFGAQKLSIKEPGDGAFKQTRRDGEAFLDNTEQNEDEENFCDIGEEIDERDKFLHDVIYHAIQNFHYF